MEKEFLLEGLSRPIATIYAKEDPNEVDPNWVE
jgi:hypothetical protein